MHEFSPTLRHLGNYYPVCFHNPRDVVLILICMEKVPFEKKSSRGWGCKLLSSVFFGSYCIPYIPNHRRRWMPLEKPKYLVIFASAYGCLGNRHSSKPHEESPLVALSHAIKTDFFVSFRFKFVTSCIII